MPQEPENGQPVQVYVVTSGEYSDYVIVSIWLTLDEATTAADDWGRVEVWPIGENQRSLGTFTHSVDLDGVTGEPLHPERTDDHPTVVGDERGEVIYWPGRNTIGIRVHASTQERADKVFSEVKARVLADISTGLPVRAIADSEFVNGGWRKISD